MKLKEIFLKEGGLALKTPRISKKDILPTIKYVSKLTGIPVDDLKPLGSVGKVETSGDIDLAVDLNKHNPSEIHKKLVKALGEDNAVQNAGTKVNSYAVPVAGKDGGDKVQVDLMFGDSIEWMQFAYYSAGEESQYKGAVRSLLLQGLAGALNEKGKDHFEYDDGELIIRAGRTWDLSSGLRRIFQYRPKKKSGEGYLSTMKSIPIDKFKEMFPDIKVDHGNIILDDPKMVTELLFGKGVKPSDIRTAEQILDLLKKKFNKEQRDKILKIAKLRAKGAKFKLPKELQ